MLWVVKSKKKKKKKTYNKAIGQVSQPFHFVNYEPCCWKQIQIDLNSYPTLLQHQFKLCWTNAGQTLKPFK